VILIWVSPIFNIEENKKTLAFRTNVTNAIMLKKMNIDEMKELVRYQYKEIFEESDESAVEFAKKFINNLDLKKERYKDLK
jgi:hypothetical protein